jgi:hypothetical protein
MADVFGHAAELLDRVIEQSRICRGCGCTDDRACITPAGPCAWVLMDVEIPTGVCSVCAVRWGWDQNKLFNFVDPRLAFMAREVADAR